MATQAPPRGVMLGRSYLGEDDAIALIRDLRDARRLLLLFAAGGGRPGPAELPGRVARTQAVLTRVMRELEDALGSSADE